VVALGLFSAHTARHRNPLIDPALFRVRPFTGACAVGVLFSMAFGAMLLSRVLWAQDVRHRSALTTGFSLVPGPIMVPLFWFLLAGRLINRFGPGPVTAAGSAAFAAGMAWMALAAGLRPDYVGDVLGGLLLTAAGLTGGRARALSARSWAVTAAIALAGGLVALALLAPGRRAAVEPAIATGSG
jgi:hypothetical protein